MILRKITHIILFIFIFSLNATPLVFAEHRIISLTDAIALVKVNNPLMAISKLIQKEATAQKLRVAGTFFSPSVEATGYTGLVPGTREGEVSSSDESNDYSDLGPFYKVDFTAKLPLYSFGKHAYARDAVAGNYKAKTEALSRTENSLVRDVIKAYTAASMSSELRKLSDELTVKYNELVVEMEASYKSETSDLSASDLFEVQTLAFEIKQKQSESSLHEYEAFLLLGGLLNEFDSSLFNVEKLKIPSLDQSEDILASCLSMVSDTSPELRKLEAEIEALDAFVHLSGKKRWPDLFLGVGGGVSRADNRDGETDSDDYNYERIGAAIGLKWTFNYHLSQYDKISAKLKYRKLQQKRILKELEIRGKLKQSWQQTKSAWGLLHAAKKAQQAAKKWKRLETENWDIGLGDIRQLIKASEKFYSLTAERDKITFAYLSALADLAFLSGDTHLMLDWINDGKVIFY